MLIFRVVIDETIEAFDREDYKARLANITKGIAEADISLGVSAASIAVVATINAQDPAYIYPAYVALDQLAKDLSDGMLSSALGVNVESAVVSFDVDILGSSALDSIGRRVIRVVGGLLGGIVLLGLLAAGIRMSVRVVRRRADRRMVRRRAGLQMA